MEMAFDGIFVSIQIIWCYVIEIDGTFLEKYKKKHIEKQDVYPERLKEWDVKYTMWTGFYRI